MSTAAARIMKNETAIIAGLAAYHGLILETTIATRASQTSFTLTAGSADNNAYNECTAVIIDAITANQVQVGRISAYTGASKTVTLQADPAVFTHAVGDTIRIFPPEAMAESKLDTIDNFVDTEVAAIQTAVVTTIPALIGTPVADVSTDIAGVASTLGSPAGASVSADIAAIEAQALAVYNTRPQESNYNLTAAANAGSTTCFTVAGSPIWVLGLTLASNGATTADLTSCQVRVGHAATLHEFIAAATAVKAAIDAAGERLVSAAVPVRLEVGDVIDGVLAGTGATAVDLDVNVLWRGTAANSALTPTA